MDADEPEEEGKLLQKGRFEVLLQQNSISFQFEKRSQAPSMCLRTRKSFS